MSPPIEDFLAKPNKSFTSITDKNISSELPGVHKLEFASLNQQEVERCINWIIERSINNSTTQAKGLYLCAVLGHLTVTSLFVKDLKMPKNEDVKQACDVLLQCLLTSFRKKLFISPKISKLLKAIAPELVANSSLPGWLTFAAYFLPLYGIQSVVEMKIPSPKYEPENYMRLCDAMLSHDILNIKNAREDQSLYAQLLTQVLELAPDEGTLFKVFANKEIKRFFYCPRDQEKFCIDFYHDNVHKIGGGNVSVSEKLQQLTNLPKNLRAQLSGLLYSCLLEFIKSVEKPTKNDLANFLNIQLSMKLKRDQVERILMLFSTSVIDLLQEMLLECLKDDAFRHQWEQVSKAQKVHICATWVKTRARYSGKIEVLKAYQVAEELISCPLVNKDLKTMLLQSVNEWLFQEVEPEVIFQELKNLEKFSKCDIRESCIHLIEEELRNNLRVVNDKRLLSYLSCSR